MQPEKLNSHSYHFQLLSPFQYIFVVTAAVMLMWAGGWKMTRLQAKLVGEACRGRTPWYSIKGKIKLSVVIVVTIILNVNTLLFCQKKN